MATGSATAALICIPRFRTLRWRTVRVGAYVALGASSFVPLLHGVQLYGLEYMMQYSGMNWYLLELAFYGGGVGLYGVSPHLAAPSSIIVRDKRTNWQQQSRTPERFAPGKFDIWGSSHQIFHVAILCAMYVHAIALKHAFTAYHTLQLCKIQAAYLAE